MFSLIYAAETASVLLVGFYMRLFHYCEDLLALLLLMGSLDSFGHPETYKTEMLTLFSFVFFNLQTLETEILQKYPYTWRPIRFGSNTSGSNIQMLLKPLINWIRCVRTKLCREHYFFKSRVVQLGCEAIPYNNYFCFLK